MADITEVDYQGLQDISRMFNNHCETIWGMLIRTRDSTHDLRGKWVGKGSLSFFKEMDNEVLPAVERLRSALDDAALGTNRIAAIFAQAEEEASGRFIEENHTPAPNS
jgi:WXG100 family type VII secretion target